MEIQFEQILLLATVLTPIVAGVTEILKRIVKKEIPQIKIFLPIIAVGIGISLGYLSYPFIDLNTDLRLWAGGLSGLAATGFYELEHNISESLFRKDK